jgi:hypothetical protein
VGEALTEHAQHDVDSDQGREDQDFLRRRTRGTPHIAGEFGADGVRQVHLGDCLQHPLAAVSSAVSAVRL